MNYFCIICREGIYRRDIISLHEEKPLHHQHHFHKDCLNEWLDRSQTCPICREVVEIEIEIAPHFRQISNWLTTLSFSIPGIASYFKTNIEEAMNFYIQERKVDYSRAYQLAQADYDSRIDMIETAKLVFLVAALVFNYIYAFILNYEMHKKGNPACDQAVILFLYHMVGLVLIYRNLMN
jgi:hypothetical protein